MNSVDARFFDNQTARPLAVSAYLIGKQLAWTGDGQSAQIALTRVRLVPAVGQGPLRIVLPDETALEIDDPAFIEALMRIAGHNDWASKLEASWPYALAALVITIVGSWAMLTFGVPIAATRIAQQVPPQYDRIMARDGLAILDRVLFEPSSLDQSTQQRLRGHFNDIIATDPAFAEYTLEFRYSEDIGANALAIPGGVVIITDDMVELADNDDELIAVLAHEVGHQAQRHSLRMLLRSAGSAAIFAALTGDLGSITAVSATLPTVLVQASYSRDFEHEADSFAFAYLEMRGIDTDVLSGLLMRLEASTGGHSNHWFSSHPSSSERVQDR
ncbi:MAG: M48 family metallopeptidase [Pseudomonadota bacterium]